MKDELTFPGHGGFIDISSFAVTTIVSRMLRPKYEARRGGCSCFYDGWLNKFGHCSSFAFIHNDKATGDNRRLESAGFLWI